MCGVPACLPWDVSKGKVFDVLFHGQVILQLILAKGIASAHFGTQCKSLTWARVQQLRNASFPLGLPGLGEWQQQLVKTGNDLAAFTVSCCAALHEHSAYCSIENPLGSWLWYLPDFRILAETDGFQFVKIRLKSFEVPTCVEPYFRPSLFLHNSPTLHRF